MIIHGALPALLRRGGIVEAAARTVSQIAEVLAPPHDDGRDDVAVRIGSVIHSDERVKVGVSGNGGISLINSGRIIAGIVMRMVYKKL